jgi:tetratricopeptide (TPR) repeat protein
LLRAGADIDEKDGEGLIPVEVTGAFVAVANDVRKEGDEEPNLFHTDMIMQTVILQRDRAIELKNKRNFFFGRKDYNKALKLYEQALVQLGYEFPLAKATVYSNRSQCYLFLPDFDSAKREAQRALDSDDTNEKAQHRLRKADEGLGLTDDAET